MVDPVLAGQQIFLDELVSLNQFWLFYNVREMLGSKGKSNTIPQPNFEAKVSKLVELGLGRAAVIQALKFEVFRRQ
nr:DNA damage-inducible protein 1 [Ipomoea batatas]GMD28128.1 DNA damage-inducible protein 1 [Ipomoea batatas]